MEFYADYQGNSAMHEQCVPGSFSSSPTQEPGNDWEWGCLTGNLPVSSKAKGDSYSRALSTLGQHLLKGGICSRVISRAASAQGGICSRVISWAISTLGQYILKGGICLVVVSVQGLNLFNAVIIQGGICSRAGSTQGWYLFKGWIYSTV